MINKELYLKLGNLVLDRIEGRMHFKMSQEERYNLVADALKDTVTHNSDSQLSELYQSRQQRHQFIERFLSFDEISDFIYDPDIEDIEINGTGPIFVHRTNYGFVNTNKSFDDSYYLDFFQRKIIIFTGRKYVRKINDYGLPNINGRVNIVQSPFGPQITITKAKELPLSIIQLIERNTLDYATAAFLWLAVEGMSLRPANLLLVGGPGTGKTTLLNALLSFIPYNERVVVIEDTLELNTKFMDNFSRLESGEDLSLQHLVKNTLRMRPERIIIGEVRGVEAQDMMTAMNIGKYCMGTIHASNTKEAFTRLENAPMNVPSPLINLIDILVVLKKFRQKQGVRRVVEEVSEMSFMHQRRPLVSVIRSYDQQKDKIVESSPFAIFRDKLAYLTGFTPQEILKELEFRAKVLYFLGQKDIKTFSEVTRFCSLYNKNKENAITSLGLSFKELDKFNLEQALK